MIPTQIFIHDIQTTPDLFVVRNQNPYDLIFDKIDHLFAAGFSVGLRKCGPYCGYEIRKDTSLTSVLIDTERSTYLALSDMTMYDLNTICEEPELSEWYYRGNVRGDSILRNIYENDTTSTDTGSFWEDDDTDDDMIEQTTLYSIKDVSKSWFIIQLKHKKFTNSEKFNFSRDFWRSSINDLKKISDQISDLVKRKNISISDARLFYKFFIEHIYGFKPNAILKKYVIDQKKLYEYESQGFCDEWQDMEEEMEPEFLGLSLPSLNINHNISLPPNVMETVNLVNSFIPNGTQTENSGPSILDKLISMGYLGATTFYIAKNHSFETFLLVVSQQVITRYGITGKLLGTGDPLSKLCGCAHMGIETIRKALSWLYQWIRGEVSWNQMGILQEDFVEEASLEEVVGEISDNNPLFALFGMVWSWMPFSSDEFSHKGKEYSQKFVHFVKGLQGIKTAFDLLPQIIEWAMCHILAWWQGCTYEDMVLARTFGEKYKQTLSSAQKIIARFEEDNLVAPLL
jgi:hypothetical protein